MNPDTAALIAQAEVHRAAAVEGLAEAEADLEAARDNRVANPGAGEPNAREMAAWGELSEEERQACLEGDAAALQTWQELAEG